MGKLKLIIWVACSFLGLSALAQNEEDALRYSLVEPLGTARFTGMGGAFGAVGGDFSSLSWNPAGVAVYRRNDLNMSLSVSSMTTDANYENTLVSQTQNAFHLPQIGVVGAYQKDDADWRFFNFAIGYQKLRNFNQSFTVRGDVQDNSLLDVFRAQAEGTDFNLLADAFPFTADLAWNTFLLDTLNSANPSSYVTAIPYGQATQQMRMETSGHMGETVLSFGGNFQDKFYFGATLGFPVVRYNREVTYTESNLDEDVDLASFTYTDELVTNGNGINIKLGTIYRATKWLRLGAAWHSPTALSFSDVWDSEMSSFFKDGDQFTANAQGGFDYNLRTPGRYIGSAAFLLGRYGIISADYHYIDYSNAKLRASNLIPDPYDFNSENATINSLYRGTHNVRIGAEWRVTRPFRLRAGYAMSQHPYADVSESYYTNTTTISGGLEWRTESWYISGAYQQRTNTDELYLYDPALVDVTTIDQSKGEFLVTIGIRY